MDSNRNRPSVILGTLLVAAGLLILVGQIFRPLNSDSFGAVIVITLGLVFFVGMVLGGRSFGSLAIPGAILTGIGLILLFQSMFNLWETWAYAWALIICFVGIGLLIFGFWSQNAELRRSGWKTIQTGFGLFLFFGILFELILGISGFSLARNSLFWPMLLVIAGLGMLILRSYRLFRRGEGIRPDDVNLFWPVMFIAVGYLWFLVNTGALAWNQLGVLINLWPLLLIAAGVDVLVGRRFQVVNLLSGIVVAGIMLYVAFNGQALGLSNQVPFRTFGIQMEDNERITRWLSGSGEMTQETRQIDGAFDSINMKLPGKVTILQGTPGELTIRAEENLLPVIVIEVNGDTLEIETEPGVAITTSKGLEITLSVEDLDEIALSGAGEIVADGVTRGDLSLALNGFGTVTVDAVQADALDVVINGSGTVNVTGEAQELKVEINGAGSFEGIDLRAEEGRIEFSGLGNARVWVTERLTTRINGAGTVAYRGDPSINQTNAGLGTVRRIDE